MTGLHIQKLLESRGGWWRGYEIAVELDITQAAMKAALRRLWKRKAILKWRQLDNDLTLWSCLRYAELGAKKGRRGELFKRSGIMPS